MFSLSYFVAQPVGFQCRSDLAAHAAAGGAVLERAGLAELGEDALDACFALIDATPAPSSLPSSLSSPAPKPNPKKRTKGVFPDPLADYVGGDLNDVKWKPVGLGVKQAILKTSREASVRLLYIPAGSAMPDHGHRGMEMTLVLQGAFRDEDARFGRGDVEICDASHQHTPVAEEGADCICLAASDAPLRFNGLLPRIAQPFLRI